MDDLLARLKELNRAAPARRRASRIFSPSGLSGIALGTVAGAALGGPVGAFLGAAVGGAAGEALERVFPAI